MWLIHTAPQLEDCLDSLAVNQLYSSRNQGRSSSLARPRGLVSFQWNRLHEAHKSSSGAGRHWFQTQSINKMLIYMILRTVLEKLASSRQVVIVHVKSSPREENYSRAHTSIQPALSPKARRYPVAGIMRGRGKSQSLAWLARVYIVEALAENISNERVILGTWGYRESARAHGDIPLGRAP